MLGRPGTGPAYRNMTSAGGNSASLPASAFSQAAASSSSAQPFPGSLNYTNITEYQQGVLLGQGNYAAVKQATHKATGMVVAIKIYDKFKLSANAQVKKSVSREIRLLAQLSGTERPADKKTDETAEPSASFGQGHSNIMRLYDAIDTPK